MKKLLLCFMVCVFLLSGCTKTASPTQNGNAVASGNNNGNNGNNGNFAPQPSPYAPLYPTSVAGEEVPMVPVIPVGVAFGLEPYNAILGAAKEDLETKKYKLQYSAFPNADDANAGLLKSDPQIIFTGRKKELDAFRLQSPNTQITDYAYIHFEPYLLYPGKTGDISKLKKTSVVGIPNTNEESITRALKLLYINELITLKDAAATTLTVQDIATQKVEIRELSNDDLSSKRAELDAMVIYGSVPYSANADEDKDNDFDLTKIWATEQVDLEYASVLALLERDVAVADYIALRDSLCSNAVKEYIEETYKGTIVFIGQKNS